MAGKNANGSGTVGKLKDGRWQARYVVKDANGQPVRRALYGRTRADAEAKLVAVLRDRNLGLISARRGRGPTLGEYAERWLPIHSMGLRPLTATRLDRLIRRHVLPSLGPLPLGRLEIAQVNDLLAAKLRAGFAPGTVRNIRAGLRTMLNSAVREGFVVRNAAALSDAPRMTQVDRVTLSPEQARTLVEAARTHRDGALWVLALSTGARQGELLALRWSDYEVDTGRIRIAHSLQRIDGKVVLAETKTNRSRRTVVLPGVAREALARQRAAQAVDRLRAGEGWRDDFGLVFTTVRGLPRDGSAILRGFKSECRALGLPPLSFHDLRHSAASLLALAGVQPRDVQSLLGHANVYLTLQTYTAVSPGSSAAIAGVMDAILSQPPAG